MPEVAMQGTFQKMDINGDGAIDKEEMFEYIKELMSMHHLKKWRGIS